MFSKPETQLSDAQLLPEVQRLIAAMPPREAFIAQRAQTTAWTGEAIATLRRWDTVRMVEFRVAIESVGTPLDDGHLYTKALTILHEARHGVILRGQVPSAAFVDTGKLLDYFKQVRELVAQAKSDLLITDRYLNAEFVERYVPFMTGGARVRLLVRRPEPTLLPAVGPAAAQHGVAIEVRAYDEVHDRCLFIDGVACYHSGASFADGGKTGPTMVTPILGFAELLAKYEAMWTAGGVLR